MVGFAMAQGALAPIFVAGSIALPGILFWLAGVLGASHVEKIPIAPLDSSASRNSSGGFAFRSLPNLGGVNGTNCRSGFLWERFLVQAAGQDKRRFVALLLRKHYDVNYEDHGGTTPLSATSVARHEKMISFLIS
jgi:hypothetical protein